MSDDLSIAQQMAARFVFESSRLQVALTAINEVASSEEGAISEGTLRGLMEASGILGDYLDLFASDQQTHLERIAEERASAKTKKGAA
ncbi:hypothetical protein ACUN9V_13325 [Salinicola sp. V024]|uniref:hypothetical protein n=1 Tax=Salinicola sp. V024 TaxID=3459609 RepID=UPI004044DE9A